MSIGTKVKRVLDIAQEALSGEPARAIGYGGAAVIYLVARVSGQITDVSLADALVQATAIVVGVASFVETIRHFVYSRNSFDATVAIVREFEDTQKGGTG